MADLQHIFTSALDPVGAPTGLGHHHINTATEESWYSVGTATVADWQRAPHVSSGAGAPATTPLRVGDVYIDTTNDLPYTAVGVASSADWSLGGGGGASGPILADDTTTYTMADDAGTTTKIIDETTRYHVITIPSGATNAGTLQIQLPNSTDLTEADGDNNVEFDIVVKTGAFASGQAGHFDLLTSIQITVNGAASVLNTTAYTETNSTSTTGVSVMHLSAVPSWAFNDVRSFLHIVARNSADSQYMLEIHRDAAAQLGA